MYSDCLAGASLSGGAIAGIVIATVAVAVIVTGSETGGASPRRSGCGLGYNGRDVDDEHGGGGGHRNHLCGHDCRVRARTTPGLRVLVSRYLCLTGKWTGVYTHTCNRMSPFIVAAGIHMHAAVTVREYPPCSVGVCTCKVGKT